MSSTLYRGGVIDSPEVPGATALLVDGDRIAWIGAADQADGLTPDAVVELDGALVTAGFVDAHAHVLATALHADGLDLSAAASLAEVLDRVRSAAGGAAGRRLAAEGAPLTGAGWDEQRWPEGRPPTRAELDQAAQGGPVYLARVDLHSGVVSSSFAEVLGLAGLPGWSEDGLVTGAAFQAAQDALTEVTPARRDRLHRAALTAAAARGVVALHEHSAPFTDTRDGLRSLLALAADPGLPLVLGFRGELCVTADDARELLTDIPGLTGIGGDLCVDGSVGSRTAALHRPYLDAPDGWPFPAGDLELSAEQISNHIAAVTRAGAQAALHAIGDRAVAELLLGVRAATDVEGLDAIRAAGHRIEHAELLDAPALAATVVLGLTASVQPAFDAAWGGPDGMYAARLGAGRAANMTPLADLRDAGVPLALGSDSPVTPVDPWGAIRAAIGHHTPEQRLSTRDALTAHTRGGWRAGRGGPRRPGVPGVPAESVDPLAGELRVGAPAHLAVWDVDDAAWAHRDEPRPTWVRAGRPAPDPVLPELSGGVPAPVCRRTVRSGVVIHDTLG
ncbi:amidohydrolase [Cellulomonas denverensis]|uniref:Amidohydrolase family protein n=2 Tax=Cellulomonas denverensis TaxID=264297 RepID=A0A7X6KTQ4_9CELL|nr:amidohydrolase family protein [Cellulomonas denverensis]NKY21915.1 amidohydrolase family protein [Cellulomonas denverensis]GIG24195.1 amidohydrolase [Cellulomonas denverensis]